jgi:hypothetical protein
VSTRPRGNVLSVWVKQNDNETKLSIGCACPCPCACACTRLTPAVLRCREKINNVLNLQDGATIEYKPHHSSMKDRSTFRNARAYKLVATGEQDQEEATSEAVAAAQ